MKKLISTMELFVGLSFKRMMAVLGGMAAVELVLFWIFGLSRKAYSFENAVKSSFIPVVFGIGFAAMFFALAWTTGKGSQELYTMQRLSVSERAAIAVQFVYYLFCFTLFVLTQIVLLLIMARLFEGGRFFSEGPQGLFVDFRINSFLHKLFPMWTTLPSINKAFCILCSAIAAVNMNVLLRHGKAPIASVILATMTGFYWAAIGNIDYLDYSQLFFSIFYIPLIVWVVYYALSIAHKGVSTEDRLWD